VFSNLPEYWRHRKRIMNKLYQLVEISVMEHASMGMKVASLSKVKMNMKRKSIEINQMKIMI
jgi:hypothetical protein